MRIAVISDIHANLTALSAVAADVARASPDLIVCAGDLVGGGPRPAQVVDFVREQGWATIIGNTDEVLWRPEPLVALLERLPAMRATLDLVLSDVEHTRALLGDARVAWLQTLPDQWSGHGVSVVHASPADRWNAPSSSAADDELERVYGALEHVVVHGHTHVPSIRRLVKRVVANSGSVGQPYDNDSRASWLLISDGMPEIRRTTYEIEAEVAALVASESATAPWISRILRGGKYVAP